MDCTVFGTYAGTQWTALDSGSVTWSRDLSSMIQPVGGDCSCSLSRKRTSDIITVMEYMGYAAEGNC